MYEAGVGSRPCHIDLAIAGNQSYYVLSETIPANATVLRQ